VLVAFAVATPLAVLIERWDPALSDSNAVTDELAQNLRVDKMMEHLNALQQIADNSSSRSRSVEYAYNKSAEYVEKKLKEAGYTVERQPFRVPTYEDLGDSVLNATAMSFSTSFLPDTEFSVMRYSGSGEENDVKLHVTEASGCVEEDFRQSNDKIALIIYDEGECSFYERALLAKNKGAKAVIMMRDGNHSSSAPPTSRIMNTSNPIDIVDIPVFGVTYQLGQELMDLQTLAEDNELRIGFKASTKILIAGTYNVLAYTDIGQASSTIVVGSHLDSVPAGPGINDNGSGSALNLALAVLFAELRKRALAYTESRILFAFWGAEELGLLGSRHYVSQLGTGNNPSVSDLALNLNYDMVASPNFIRGIYNGSGAESAVIRNKCIGIQRLFQERFNQKGLAAKLEDFTGRSDYGPFIEEGIDIPAGGLFTGAEVVKTVQDQKDAGGVANVAYDPCYHQACDDINNINTEALQQMGDAAAYVLERLIVQSDVRGYLENLGQD
jgi:hypothetical protein